MVDISIIHIYSHLLGLESEYRVNVIDVTKTTCADRENVRDDLVSNLLKSRFNGEV